MDFTNELSLINTNIQIELDKIEDKDDKIFNNYIENLMLLQNTVDELIDNSPSIETSSNYNSVALKLLTEILKGKGDRFRHNILGKRVDYSGRSVIVPCPSLSVNECAIPRAMAVELFKPFIYYKTMLKLNLQDQTHVQHALENNIHSTYEILEEIVDYCPVLLNRVPILHKLSMRVFWVRLTNEKVIRLHPLVCTGFNADFDGDQMAVHVPLSFNARIEAMALLITRNNVLHPAYEDPVILPTQDMILAYTTCH